MIIEDIELRLVELPLRHPFATAAGVMSQRRVALVRLRSEGLEGWGECSPVPGYSAETIDQAWQSLIDWVPGLAGQDLDPRRLAAPGIPPSAAAAVEGAVWDLAARARGEPLWRFLGGTGPRVAAGAVLGLGSGLSAAEAALGAGYRHLKLKIAPDFDRKPLSALRSVYPTVSLGADGNGSYSSGHIGALVALDDFGLSYLEQPLPAADLEGHAELARVGGTPICLDEGVTGRHAARAAIAAEAADSFNLKAPRLGGIEALLAIRALAIVDGISLRAGGMVETGIGRAHAVAVATLPGFDLPGDVGASDRYFARDLVSPPWTLDDGFLVAPDAPGIGVTVDAPALTATTIARVTPP